MKWNLVAAVLLCQVCFAQSAEVLRDVLDRLAKLEEQNRALAQEVRQLKERLGETSVDTDAPLAERVEVTEQRVADLDQTRVAADNKFPVTLTGLALFNAFLNGQASAGAQFPGVIPAAGRSAGAGGTFRQSVIGLKMAGPKIWGGGRVEGAVNMDFFAGGTGLNQTMRLRTAALDVNWKNTSVGVAFDKPIIAPRDPDSLAQVGISPLSANGNLWVWQPQVRVEQRVQLVQDRLGLRVQGGVYQTTESRTGIVGPATETLSAARPGYQGRFELWAQSGTRRIEVAPGFHASSTRVLGQSVGSRVFAVDWLLRPFSRVDLTGTFFNGTNVGVIGGIQQGISIVNGTPLAVHSMGGWAQLKIRATSRATIHLMSGQQDDRNGDLLRSAVLKNQAHGANIMYRWGPNIITSFEAMQGRTSYFGNKRINPHYDLAIAYLF